MFQFLPELVTLPVPVTSSTYRTSELQLMGIQI